MYQMSSRGCRTLATEQTQRHRFTIHSAPHDPSSVTTVMPASATYITGPPVAASDGPSMNGLSIIATTMPPRGATRNAPMNETMMFKIQPSTPPFLRPCLVDPDGQCGDEKSPPDRHRPHRRPTAESCRPIAGRRSRQSARCISYGASLLLCRWRECPHPPTDRRHKYGCCRAIGRHLRQLP